MATPIGAQVGKSFESMRYAMIEFLFVRIGLSIGLAYALGNDFGETVRVTSIFAVFALHARRVFEELATERASHDTIELLSDELVAILFLDLFFALSDGTFSAKAGVETNFPPVLLCLEIVSGYY